MPRPQRSLMMATGCRYCLGLESAGDRARTARIHKGGHVANPKVRIVQGERVNIETFSVEDAMPIEADGMYEE